MAKKFKVSFTLTFKGATKSQIVNDLEWALDCLPQDDIEYSDIQVVEVKENTATFQ